MKNITVFLVFSLVGTNAIAQDHLVPTQLFDAIAREFSGEAAKERTQEISQYHRIQGSPMMLDVAEKVVVPRLRAAGVEATIEKFPSDGRTS